MKTQLALSGKYNTLAAIIAGGILASLLISLVLIRPIWGKLQNVGQQISQVQSERDRVKQDVDRLRSGQDFLENNPEVVSRVNTALPTTAEVPAILVMLEALAKQNGVYLTSFTPQQLQATGRATQTPAPPNTGQRQIPTGGADLATPPDIDTMEITAEYAGSYPALINFFYSLERSLRIVDVRSLQVESRERDNALTGAIAFRAYFKTPEPVTAPATPGGEGEV